MRKIKFLLVLGILGICLIGTGFVTDGFAEQDINIAFLVPLTGSGAFYGAVMRDVGQGVVNVGAFVLKPVERVAKLGRGQVLAKFFQAAQGISA